MQGQLLGRPVTVLIESSCAHCGRELRIEATSDGSVRVPDDPARSTGHPPAGQPVLSVPDVDLLHLDEPHIIDAF